MAVILLAFHAMLRITSRQACVAVASLLVVVCAAAPAHAATIDLGYFAFDQFLAPVPDDPGSNVFTIWNFTGDLAILDNNPLNAVTFDNATLTLNNDTDHPIDLGSIVPGQLVDPFGSPLVALQFISSAEITSAVFTATLSTTTFLMADGSTLNALDPVISFALPVLGPGTPGTLLANPLDGSDFATLTFFDIEAVPPSEVPEPGTLMLVAAGLGAAVFTRRRTRRT